MSPTKCFNAKQIQTLDELAYYYYFLFPIEHVSYRWLKMSFIVRKDHFKHKSTVVVISKSNQHFIMQQGQPSPMDLITSIVVKGLLAAWLSHCQCHCLLFFMHSSESVPG